MLSVKQGVFSAFLWLVAAGFVGCGTVENTGDTRVEPDAIEDPTGSPDSSAQLLSRLRALSVAAPATACPAYDSDDYSYSSSLEYELVLDYDGVYDPYNDRWYDTLDSLSVLDIEHIVARKEAHISGLCLESVDMRVAFAQDSLNLALASSRTNRQKSDKDAAEWMPEFNKCWFIRRIIEVREQYGLTIDLAERNTLSRQIDDCTSFELTSASERPLNPLHDERPGCPAEPYPNCAALQEHYPHGVYRTHCAYNQNLDRDSDGWICLGG